MGSLPIQSDVSAVAVDPTNPERVYVAGTGGVARSDDSARTWQASSEGLENVEVIALAINPTAPDTIFAATANGDLYQSDDGATTWRRVGA